MSTMYMEKLDELKEKLTTAQKEYNEHKKSCTHNIQKNTATGNAVCKLCEKDFGQWCQNSEDHVCHYDVEIIPMYGQVKLNNNTEIGIDISNMSLSIVHSDKCIYCGEHRRRD